MFSMRSLALGSSQTERIVKFLFVMLVIFWNSVVLNAHLEHTSASVELYRMYC